MAVLIYQSYGHSIAVLNLAHRYTPIGSQEIVEAKDDVELDTKQVSIVIYLVAVNHESWKADRDVYMYICVAFVHRQHRSPPASSTCPQVFYISAVVRSRLSSASLQRCVSAIWSSLGLETEGETLFFFSTRWHQHCHHKVTLKTPSSHYSATPHMPTAQFSDTS